MARRGHYNPLQPRDSHGRFAAKAGNAAFNAVTNKVGAGKKASKSVKVTKGRGPAPLTPKAALKELKRNTIPYVRVNKRSQTIGVNAGTRIPLTHKRVVFGSYSRLESTRRHTTADRIAGKAVSKLAPSGTKRGRAVAYARKNFTVTNPAIRGSVGGAQVRLGTSRGAGPTIIVRRGKHKTSQAKSASGVKKYDTAMSKIAGKRAAGTKKRSRPQRRRAAQKKRK